MKINYTRILCIAAIAFLAGCKQNKETPSVITGDEIKSHIAVLADDSLMGRKPFTAGETKAIAYISSQFKKEGLEPGNNGSYFQHAIGNNGCERCKKQDQPKLFNRLCGLNPARS
jgi:hypothetical protein